MLCSAPFTFKIKYLTSFIPETDVCSSYCDKAHCERVGKYNFISEIAVRFGSVPFNPIVTKWNVENATPIKVGIVKWITDLNVSALSDWNICSEDEQWALKRFRLSNSIFSRRFNSITTLSLSLALGVSRKLWNCFHSLISPFMNVLKAKSAFFLDLFHLFSLLNVVNETDDWLQLWWKSWRKAV